MWHDNLSITQFLKSSLIRSLEFRYRYKVHVTRAVHRAKSGRNFAIGEGYLFFFFAPRRGTGCLFPAPCPDRVSCGAKKKKMLTRSLTRFLTRLLSSITHIYIVDNSNFTSPIILPFILTLFTLIVFFSALAPT